MPSAKSPSYKFVKVYRKCRVCKGTKVAIKREYMGQSCVEYKETCDNCDRDGMEYIGFEEK